MPSWAAKPGEGGMMIEINTELFSKIYRLAEHISERGAIEKDAYVVPIHKARLDTLFAELKQLLKEPQALKQRSLEWATEKNVCLECCEEWGAGKSACPICHGRLTPYTFSGKYLTAPDSKV